MKARDVGLSTLGLGDMTLTTEQAIALNARPRMTEAEVEQMIVMRANGMSAAEIAEQFPQYAAGTVFNKLSKRKAQVDDLRRARSVQFEDIPGVRKQTRVNDAWEERCTYKFLVRAHLESCYATNPVTGEREFVEQLVDARKLKVYSEMVFKANRIMMVEMGQQIAPLPAVGAVTESRRFAGADGAGGVDYGELVQKHAEWVAAEPERERAKAVRQEWRWYDMLQRYRSITDLEAAHEQVQRDKDKASGMSPHEYHQAIWDRKLERKRERNYEDFERFCANEVAGSFAEYGPDGVTLAEIAEGVKWSFPQTEEVQAEVDEWFAGEFCARVVETARKACAPESAAAPGPPLAPTLQRANGCWWMTRWEWRRFRANPPSPCRRSSPSRPSPSPRAIPAGAGCCARASRQILLAQVDAEAAHLWISDKVTRRAWRQKMIEDMEVALADPDLDWRQRSRFNRDIAMLLHQVDEEKGELPPRTSKVEVTF